MLMKRLLLHHIVQPEALNVEKASMQDVLRTCGQETPMPWLLAAAISMCKVSLLGLMFRGTPGGAIWHGRLSIYQPGSA